MNAIPEVLPIWEIPDSYPRPAKPPEPSVEPTFEQLCKIDRDLWRLAIDVRDEWSFAERRRFFCANECWCRYYKPRLCLLVGWGSYHPEPLMRTQAAYNVAYHAIYKLLPNCRGCTCL